MTPDTEMPIFSNTCGKLFNDKVVFASAMKETEINAGEIKNISFGSRISASGILFIVLPVAMFILAYMLHEAETFLKFFMGILGAVILVTSILKAEKRYRLKVSLKNGETITWNVWEGNVNEANKFVHQVKSRIKMVA